MTYPPMKCPTCGGDGYTEHDVSHGDYTEAIAVECSDCGGTGIEPEDAETDNDPQNWIEEGN